MSAFSRFSKNRISEKGEGILPRGFYGYRGFRPGFRRGFYGFGGFGSPFIGGLAGGLLGSALIGGLGGYPFYGPYPFTPFAPYPFYGYSPFFGPF